jgi:hypothetical protein
MRVRWIAGKTTTLNHVGSAAKSALTLVHGDIRQAASRRLSPAIWQLLGATW